MYNNNKELFRGYYTIHLFAFYVTFDVRDFRITRWHCISIFTICCCFHRGSQKLGAAFVVN